MRTRPPGTMQPGHLCASQSLVNTGHHYRVPLSHLFLKSWPTARKHNRSTSGIQGMGHVGIATLVDLLACMATVQLQHVHTPFCKSLEGCVCVCGCDWKHTSKILNYKANLIGNFGPLTPVTHLCVSLYVSKSARVATTG